MQTIQLLKKCKVISKFKHILMPKFRLQLEEYIPQIYQRIYNYERKIKSRFRS